MAAYGYEATKWVGPSYVRSPRIKRSIEPIAAAHHDLSIGYVSFAVSKRK
jgi:hypothetical protein